MDFKQAMEWVEDHKDVAKKWFYKYGSLTPYGAEDFQSVVQEAALVAAIAHGDKPISAYEAIFVRTLQMQMATLIPGYGYYEGKRGGVGANVSMSIPSSSCISYDAGCFVCDMPDDDADLGIYDQRYDADEFVNPAYTAEHAFDLVSHYLSDRQKTVLSHTLGLSEKGALSAREIEKEENISKSTVSRELSKITDLVTDLVATGSLAIYSPLPSPSTLEFDVRQETIITGIYVATSLSEADTQTISSGPVSLVGPSVWSGFLNIMVPDGRQTFTSVVNEVIRRFAIIHQAERYSIDIRTDTPKYLSRKTPAQNGLLSNDRPSPALTLVRNRYGVVKDASKSDKNGLRWSMGCVSRGDPDLICAK